MKRTTFGLFAVFCILLLGATCLEAQTISGNVTDTSNASIAGAKIEVKNVGTNVMQTTVTDGQGRYTLSNLSIGEYELQASQQGFSTVVRKGITLAVGSQIVVDFSLPVGQVNQTVSVQGEASQVETSSTTVGAVVQPMQMVELPLNGRNFSQLILLAPGVQSTQAGQMGFGINNGIVTEVPLAFHLINPLLGSNCYVGTTSNPIVLNLTTGTSGSLTGNLGSLDPYGPFAGGLYTIGTEVVDNQFTVPAATGCGAGGVWDSAITALEGSDSPGSNTAIFYGNYALSLAKWVKQHGG